MTAVDHWFEEVWNKQNESAIDELGVPEKRTHGLAAEYGKQVKNKDEFKAFHELLSTAFHVHVPADGRVARHLQIKRRLVSNDQLCGSL